MSEGESRLIRALNNEPPDRIPIWFMRQAGRYLPEYRAMRERYSILDIIRNPELSAEVTLQPIERFAVDAAVIFADILPPLAAMGLDIDFVEGDGPVIRRPITQSHDVDMLAVPPAKETLGSTLEAIRLVSAELESRRIPVVGFAGGPFTLASYAIEGGTSRNFSRTKAFLYSEPAAWKRLMTKLVAVQIDYLRAQVDAGAKVLQVFDSWAGLALGREEYREYVLPFNQSLFRALESLRVPLINFSTGTAAFIEVVADSSGTAVGVDWRLPIDEYRKRLGDSRPLQGNLDPAVLLAPWREIRFRTDDLLRRAATIGGYVFNLGHGVLPETPPEVVARLVEYVHEWTEVEHAR